MQQAFYLWRHLWDAGHRRENVTELAAEYAGFDGPDHLEYIRFVGERWALPLATDGPAMYHPPLFYVVAAGLRATAGEQPGTLVRLVPFLSGIFQVAIAFLLARLSLALRRAREEGATVCVASGDGGSGNNRMAPPEYTRRTNTAIGKPRANEITTAIAAWNIENR